MTMKAVILGSGSLLAAISEICDDADIVISVEHEAPKLPDFDPYERLRVDTKRPERTHPTSYRKGKK